MIEPATTCTSTALLRGLCDHGNNAAWEELDTRYRPIITGFARRMGLSAEDAADVAQDALVKFAQDYQAGKYDRGRGRLRTWLMIIVKYRVLDIRRANANRREQAAGSVQLEIEDEKTLDQLWESERRASILRQALTDLKLNSRISEKTVSAFEQYVLKERQAEVVAAELGMTTHDVYMAKNRVAEKLREMLDRLEHLFDDG